MRLSCPNCGAQYEVPLEVIPTAGRDVQCSNCGHTWFQIHPDEDIELAEEVGGSIPDHGWMPSGTEAGDVVAREAAEDPVDQSDGDEVQPPEVFFEEDTPSEEDDSFQESDESEDTPDDTQASTEEADDSDQSPELEETAPEEAIQDDTSDVEADDASDAPDSDPEDKASDVPVETEAQDTSDDDHDTPDEDHDSPDETAEDDDEASETDSSDSDPNDTLPVRQGIDPAVADVLRQEAEYETQAREADAHETLEMQQELGLDDRRDEDEPQSEEARARMLRIRGLTESEENTPSELDTAAHHPRRELLPDIEEINSTLRSTDDRNASEAASGAVPTKALRRNGFRLGIAIMILLATLLLVTYSYNREITKSYPATEPVVTALMQKMNGARVWLDSLVTDGMLWLDDKAEESSKIIN